MQRAFRSPDLLEARLDQLVADVRREMAAPGGEAAVRRTVTLIQNACRDLRHHRAARQPAA